MSYPHLRGQLALPRNPLHRYRFKALLSRLNRCAELDKSIWHVNSGYRTYAQQKALYDAYLNGTGNLAARPGTSNHEKGLAADVSAATGKPVGAASRRRKLLKDHTLCLPVKGEQWHVERGSTWRA